MPSALAVAMTTTRTIQGLSNERAQNLSICGLYTIPRGLIRLPGRSEGRTVQTVTAPMGADAERPPEMRDAPCHREKLWLFLHAPPQRVEATIAVAGKRAKGVPASAVPSSGAKSFEIRFEIRRQRLSVPARFIDSASRPSGTTFIGWRRPNPNRSDCLPIQNWAPSPIIHAKIGHARLPIARTGRFDEPGAVQVGGFAEWHPKPPGHRSGTNCHSQEGAFQLSLTPRSYPVGDMKNNDLG